MSILGKPIILPSGGGGSGIIIPKTFNANGTYYASTDNADGYSPVTVDVSGGGRCPRADVVSAFNFDNFIDIIEYDCTAVEVIQS